MEVLICIGFLTLIALIVFKKEVLEFLGEKTGIRSKNKKDNNDNGVHDENDSGG